MANAKTDKVIKARESAAITMYGEAQVPSMPTMKLASNGIQFLRKACQRTAGVAVSGLLNFAGHALITYGSSKEGIRMTEIESGRLIAFAVIPEAAQVR